LPGADAIIDGQHVVYVDFEDGTRSVTDRLINLGATWEAILTYFHYFRSETPMDRKAVSYVLGRR
jgi:hypothetical protein